MTKTAKNSAASISVKPLEANILRNIDKRLRVLWIAPNFNHYKKKFLARLAAEGGLDLVVLAGRTPLSEGHANDETAPPFQVIDVPAQARSFGYHPGAYWETMKCVLRGNFDAVLMPSEKKFLFFVLWLVALRACTGFRLVSYSHPVIRSRHDRITQADTLWTRGLFSLYDRLVFYTEEARDQAVKQELLPARKAAYANNTLDTDLIWRHYEFEINTRRPPVLLFIGRLTAIKRVDLLLDYYSALKQEIPGLRLTLIGDGPEAGRVRAAQQADPDIRWCGSVIDESAIAKEMRGAHVVFIPGWSGLSIVHSFAYGKPYMTLAGLLHAPELSYLRDGQNGLLLNGSCVENIARIKTLLGEPDAYASICGQAFKTAQSLSVDRWCEQMAQGLKA